MEGAPETGVKESLADNVFEPGGPAGLLLLLRPVPGAPLRHRCREFLPAPGADRRRRLDDGRRGPRRGRQDHHGLDARAVKQNSGGILTFAFFVTPEAAPARWCRSSRRSMRPTTSPSRALVEDAADRDRSDHRHRPCSSSPRCSCYRAGRR